MLPEISCVVLAALGCQHGRLVVDRRAALLDYTGGFAPQTVLDVLPDVLHSLVCRSGLRINFKHRYDQLRRRPLSSRHRWPPARPRSWVFGRHHLRGDSMQTSNAHRTFLARMESIGSKPKVPKPKPSDRLCFSFKRIRLGLDAFSRLRQRFQLVAMAVGHKTL